MKFLDIGFYFFIPICLAALWNAGTPDSCSHRCGELLSTCSCQVTCQSLRTCCLDYKEFCLHISPHSGSLMGGKDFEIENTVFNTSSRLKCRFKQKIETSGYVAKDGKAHCISPLLYETGFVPFEVSADDGLTFPYSGSWLSVHHSKVSDEEKSVLVNATKWEYYGTPNTEGNLSLTWKHEVLPATHINIEVWGYEEIGESYSDNWLAIWKYLYTLAREAPNTGTFSFTPVPVKGNYSTWDFGILRITPSNYSDGQSNVPSVWSSEHALAWHLGEDFRNDPSAWATAKCLEWDRKEEKLPNFLEEITDCPCTLAQARADTGRFHTDYGCDIEKGSVCTYHPGAVHCVRAIQASPQYAAGQQCCYDATGTQILTQDSTGGSTPDRGHDWGSPPFMKPPRIPGFSHWLYDVISFYYCCLWSDNCQFYMKHRPSSDCRKYRPPRAACKSQVNAPTTVGKNDLLSPGLMNIICGGGCLPQARLGKAIIPKYLTTNQLGVHMSYGFKHVVVHIPASAFGDPHFVTFDGLNFTFKGHGEYTFVESDLTFLRVQGRTQQARFPNGSEAQVTGLSAVAMQENNSDVIEVRYSGDLNMEVLLNQMVVNFSEQSWMDLKGLFLHSTVDQTITVMFSSGAGVEIRGSGGFLMLTVLLPEKFMNHTQGLFGVMNGNIEDEYTFKNKTTVSVHANPQQLFEFGADWAVENGTSLFTYDTEFLLNNFFFGEKHNSSFLPVFFPYEDPADPLVKEMILLCDSDPFCRFDVLTTRSLQVGNSTKLSHQNHKWLVENLKSVISCGWLDHPANGRKEGTNYLSGSAIHFICNQGYELTGSKERICQATGVWSGETTSCILRTDAKQVILLGCIFGAVGLVVLARLIFLCRKERYKHNQKLVSEVPVIPEQETVKFQRSFQLYTEKV